MRDLASRNGTWVRGEKLQPGEVRCLALRDSLTFGFEAERWVFEDDAPPGPSALRDDGTRIRSREGLLLLPDPEHPEISVSWEEASWMLEGDFPSRIPHDGERIRLNGVGYELELPAADQVRFEGQTESTHHGESALALDFFVAAAEEHVQVEARFGGRVGALGARSHNYPLLVLARKRADDVEQGVCTREAGWLYLEELLEMLRTDRKQLNQLIWRAKQSLEKLGIPSQQLIERRPDSGQLRLGPAKFRVRAPRDLS